VIGRDQSGDLNVPGRIILKRTFNKQTVRLWTAYYCLKIGHNGRVKGHVKES
jgi:hypothetical protein